jgi:hypothetical protein
VRAKTKPVLPTLPSQPEQTRLASRTTRFPCRWCGLSWPDGWETAAEPYASSLLPSVRLVGRPPRQRLRFCGSVVSTLLPFLCRTASALFIVEKRLEVR